MYVDGNLLIEEAAEVAAIRVWNISRFLSIDWELCSGSADVLGQSVQIEGDCF
jgi:hypothetical protein